jgi:hypothetical protein
MAGSASAETDDTSSVEDLSPELKALRQKVRRCLAHYFFHRTKDVKDHSPWCVMHGVVGFGVDAVIRAEGRRMNAISWLCTNQSCQGRQLMMSPSAGKLDLRSGPGYQGHDGQLLCVLAMSRVTGDYPLTVGKNKFTVRDLVKIEQQTCRPGTELSFKLVGLAYYVDSDADWTSDDGQRWDLSRIVREELAQPINGVACGGTHRLMGLSYAVRKRQVQDQPVTGQWWRAKKFLDDYHAYTLKLQNADGSFSSNWFRSRGDWGGAPRKLNTTGHILEWLVYSLPKERLTDPQIVKAVNFLAELMWRNRSTTWEVGPEGHAIHALALYDEYVFGGRPGNRHIQLAHFRNLPAEGP